MDLPIVTLEITNLVIAFDHFDSLIAQSAAGNEDYLKMHAKGRDHLSIFAVYDGHGHLKTLPVIKQTIAAGLSGLKTKDVHELVERLEKDVKKLKKLYKAVTV
ncbi:hypothetical protein C8P68_10492 [Mucilaginibacter yixingensis]|uniref:PPM-type phosphatase domain-containing protein n=1 Tax=Mucilaginibacter yixingensis TaxID=1295612 RepID=A0A2T5J970_9SPHI|nr:hypothetical protein [Mucilaginibacter yixingensis]PTQ96607.1 hypothetical protein C8P68_10492 [Mucilaginibacter yixingensis]